MKRVKEMLIAWAALTIPCISSAANYNPATIQYVDDTITRRLQEVTTYYPGTAISIINNIISGAYTAGTGISINGAEISGAYTQGTGISINGATISGAYTQGTGISINGAEISGAYTAGTGIDITGSTISATPTYAVGDAAQGGVVVYVDESGQHGLVIGLLDVGGGTTYKLTSNDDELGTGNGLGQGLINTAAMLGHATSDRRPNAATLLAEYYRDQTPACTVAAGNTTGTSGDCYAEWYVPTVYEWQLVLDNYSTVATALGANALSTTSNYWTSTVVSSSDTTSAYALQFDGAGSATISELPVNSGDSANHALIRGFRQF